MHLKMLEREMKNFILSLHNNAQCPKHVEVRCSSEESIRWKERENMGEFDVWSAYDFTEVRKKNEKGIILDDRET